MVPFQRNISTRKYVFGAIKANVECVTYTSTSIVSPPTRGPVKARDAARTARRAELPRLACEACRGARVALKLPGGALGALGAGGRRRHLARLALRAHDLPRCVGELPLRTEATRCGAWIALEEPSNARGAPRASSIPRNLAGLAFRAQDLTRCVGELPPLAKTTHCGARFVLERPRVTRLAHQGAVDRGHLPRVTIRAQDPPCCPCESTCTSHH